jgi:hypothetical protein
MKKKILMSLIPIFIHLYLFAQEQNDTTLISKSTVFFELGNGGVFSLNYNRLEFYRKSFKIYANIGVSNYPKGDKYFRIFDYHIATSTYIYSAEIDFNYGNINNFEIGAGYNFLLKLRDSHTVYDFYTFPSVRIGYRFQKPYGGLFFRSGLTIPVLFLIDQNLHYINIGVGIGYTFKKNN